MIKYVELVDYIKRNHINWNTDIFDVLRGFFEEHSNHDYLPLPPSTPPIEQELILPKKFKEPDKGEYNIQDVLDLFSI